MSVDLQIVMKSRGCYHNNGGTNQSLASTSYGQQENRGDKKSLDHSFSITQRHHTHLLNLVRHQPLLCPIALVQYQDIIC